MYLWSTALYNSYAPYIQEQLPDVNIEFVVGNNDLDFYKFMNEHRELPDIITSRRFSRHDAVGLKDQLMDLSTTEEAGAVYESYISDFTNTDGSINWLPFCGEADGIVANKALDEIVLSMDHGYSNIFYKKGGNESNSAMANTLRGFYGSGVLMAHAYSFTGSVIQADYTEKLVSSMIMPNSLVAFHREMTGSELKEYVRSYVEGGAVYL